jgi:4-hydroxy-tetrahydrodipicolinate synthase
MKKLEGTFVVSVTPMTRDEDVDLNAFQDNLDYFINNGVHGIAINGSTSEFATLSLEELKALMDAAVEVVNGRVPLIGGTAACSTRRVVELSKYAEQAGLDGLLIVPPYYSKIDDDEVFDHFRVINEAVNLPIMIYNNPWTSKIDLQPEELAKLTELDNVQYVKESSGDVTRIRRILDLTDGKMSVFCGSDNLALESFFMGATGFICVAANIFPKHMSKLYEYAYIEGDYEKARELYVKLLPLCNFLEGSGKFTQTSKYGLDYFGKKAGPPRKPFLPLSEMQKRQAEEIFKKIQKIQL